MGDPESSPVASGLPLSKQAETPWALGVFSVAAALLCAGWGLASAGIWDPPELWVAEAARRIANGLWGAGLPQAPNELLPTRGELGRGELPFLASALGLRLFGLSAWAGRLPLLGFGLGGLLAVYFLTTRLAGRRVAWLAVLVLGTSPLYYLQARAMQGDIVTFAGGAAVLAGLGVAVFDPRSGRDRALGLALALLGLLVGFFARGLVFGVAVPLLGVGLAWLSRATAGLGEDRLGTGLGLASVGVGALALVSGLTLSFMTPADRYSMWVGAQTGGAHPVPTFDIVIRDLGHALFPWSAVLLPAVGRCLSPDPRAPLDPARGRARALQLAALATLAAALFAQTALTSELGLLPFMAPAPCAVLIAACLVDIERRPTASRAFAACVAALGLILLLDFRNFPQKGLVAFGVPDATFPESYAALGFRFLAVPALLAWVAFFSFVEVPEPSAEVGILRADYRRWPRTLLTAWSGQLWFVLLVCFFGLIGFELTLAASDRGLHLAALQDVSAITRQAVRAGWIAVLAGCALPSLLLLAQDLSRALLDRDGALHQHVARRFGWCWTGFGRGVSAAVVLAVAAVAQATLYYPGLLDTLSPKRAFDAYLARARQGEPLALLSMKVELARYRGLPQVEGFRDIDAALKWLRAPGPRHFLALQRRDLAGLNAAHRLRTTPAANVSVLDAASDVLLVSDRLAPDEQNVNPLSRVVLEAPPRDMRKVDANLGGKLDVLGWDVRDAAGARVDRIAVSKTYEFSIYYRVLERITGRWETFVHFDGFQRRFNADHPTLGDAYPFWLWLPGDILADRCAVRLEPNFAPGRYRVFFGLFAGSRRLEVRRGVSEENRIFAGDLEVR